MLHDLAPSTYYLIIAPQVMLQQHWHFCLKTLYSLMLWNVYNAIFTAWDAHLIFSYKALLKASLYTFPSPPLSHVTFPLSFLLQCICTSTHKDHIILHQFCLI